ncbi:MAG: hypothetical protein ACFCVE_13820 [Phycisphaerae bacterium]
MAELTSKAIPVRFWWLKRLAAAFVLWAAAMAGVWFGWHHYAAWKLERTVAAYVAEGRMIDPATPFGRTVPEELNAVVPLERALGRLNQYPGMESTWYDTPRGTLPLSSSEVEKIKPLQAWVRENWPDLHESQGREQIDFGRPFGDSARPFDPTIRFIRILCERLSYAALLEAHEGRFAAGVETALAAERFSRRVARIEPGSYSFFLSSFLNTPVLQRLMEVAAYRLYEAEPVPLTAQERAWFEQAVAQLGEGPMVTPQEVAAGTRTAMLTDIRLNRRWFRVYAMPQVQAALDLETVRLLRWHVGLDGAPTPAPGAAVGRARGFVNMAARPLPLAHAYDYVERPYVEQNEATRAVVRTAIAVGLYRNNHGRWPADLPALVPAYLPAVPQDPFDARRPLKYTLPPGGVPVIYSVGPGEVDTGGPATSTLFERQFGGNLGLVLHLTARQANTETNTTDR